MQYVTRRHSDKGYPPLVSLAARRSWQLTGSLTTTSNRPSLRTAAMGKKAKTTKGKIKASLRKVDKASLPAPPPPIAEEVRQ